MTITTEQAQKILNERNNGYLEGISSGKGGRAWLGGEWTLAELEALCVLIRKESGDYAQSAEELIAVWEELDNDSI